MIPFIEKTFPFTVDLPGLIDLMGTSLYSEPTAAIRELIQNAHDGIVRRRRQEIGFDGKIRFVQDSETGQLSVEDDGIGLNAEEAEKYLGTLGIGITGMLRRNTATQTNDGLIGQFGIGLLSAFLLSERIVVESRRFGEDAVPIRWEADGSTIIRLSQGNRLTPGTTVTLQLRSEHRHYAESAESVEESVRKYADFLNVPIFLNENEQRINLCRPLWFEPEAEEDDLMLALESWFNETPLGVIPIRIEKPVVIQGALYISPQRVPGFTDEAKVATTIRRMIISRSIQGLMPPWASFVRGILELTNCRPTASREELVRDEKFNEVKQTLEKILFDYFERLAKNKPTIWEALINWHRYAVAGSALENERLRKLLHSTYRFSTHRGKLTFEEILERSPASVVFENEADYVIWYHGDRRQEAAIESVFAEHKTPCVHATMAFEESLLVSMSFDMMKDSGMEIDCRVAVPGSKGFSQTILGAKDSCPVDDDWAEYFESLDAKVFQAECNGMQPVYAFLNERCDLIRTIDALKKGGDIPDSFRRMLDKHLEGEELPQNEILLNWNHPLVERALSDSPTGPRAAVLRILVFQAVQGAGAQLSREIRELFEMDLQQIADAF